MNATQLRAEAARHERDADFHQRDAAKYAGRAAYWRAHGDPERAAVFDVMVRAAERCERNSLIRAEGARVSARALEAAEERFGALAEITRRNAA